MNKFSKQQINRAILNGLRIARNDWYDSRGEIVNWSLVYDEQLCVDVIVEFAEYGNKLVRVAIE